MKFVSALRLAVKNGYSIELDGSSIGSSENVIIKGKNDGNGDKYSLSEQSGVEASKSYNIGTVYFCWIHKDATVTDYIAKCEEAKIPVITFLERTDLISYINGDIETCEYVKEDDKVEGGKDSSSRKVRKADEKNLKKKSLEKDEMIDYKEIKKQKIENDELLKEINKHEVELIDHNKTLRGSQKNNDFSNLVRESEFKIIRVLKSQDGNKKSGSSGSGSGSSNSKKEEISHDASLSTILHKKDPIIILSPSAISMITMNNVKSFLQDGKFIDSNKINEDHGNNNNIDIINIIRDSKRFNKKIKFVIVNNVEKFFIKPEYWDRVVAVFTTGQEWQFKPYKINNPNKLFQKVKGFYINYNGDLIPNNIKNWNVEIISLDRNQRFKDRQISEHLWESVERFMLSRGYK